MKTIKLKCQTLGRGFGDVIEVGDKKDQISMKDAKSLIAEGHAEELKDVVVASAKELEKENKSLTAQVEALTATNTDLVAQVEALTAELEAAKAGKK